MPVSFQTGSVNEDNVSFTESSGSEHVCIVDRIRIQALGMTLAYIYLY